VTLIDPDDRPFAACLADPHQAHVASFLPR
jgi:hypothetical protein